MQTKTSTTIGFIGLGLIGGSIAKAIRQYYPDYQILAFDKSRETLALAMQDGTIDISCTAIDEQFSHCSYLFLCAPISYNNAYLSQLKDLIHPDCILTDVGRIIVKTDHERSPGLVWMQISSGTSYGGLRKKRICQFQGSSD